MEARLDVVVSLMERISGEFQELKESFQELKAENSVLRKEIMGIGARASSSGEKGMELMENTTLRELVEEIQFDVKALNVKVKKSLEEKKCSENRNKSAVEKQPEQDLSFADNDVENGRDPVEMFPVVEIKFKTLAEQRDRMKKTFADSVKQRSVSEGASFGGRTLQRISASVVRNPNKYSTSCTIKLSNHLSYAITDPRFHFWYGSKTSGPSKVDPNFSEVFTFQGPLCQCSFLCSFGISSSLRLTIYSCTVYDGRIEFGMAFTPQDVPTDPNLFVKLTKIMNEPDIWMHITKNTKEPIEVIINHGKLHVQGHMTPGPFSVIHIDITKVSDTDTVAFPVLANLKPLETGESIIATLTTRNLLLGSSLNKITCIIEIGNCLNSTLKNLSAYFGNSTRNYILHSKILPFYRERLCASDDKTVEAMVSYEIESTDLCLVVALRAESGNNSFAVAFAQVPVEANRGELVALMDPKAWKTHLYKKYSHAKDGEQMVQIRNIRASVTMTEDAESLLKIRIFAV